MHSCLQVSLYQPYLAQYNTAREFYAPPLTVTYHWGANGSSYMLCKSVGFKMIKKTLQKSMTYPLQSLR